MDEARVLAVELLCDDVRFTDAERLGVAPQAFDVVHAWHRSEPWSRDLQTVGARGTDDLFGLFVLRDADQLGDVLTFDRPFGSGGQHAHREDATQALSTHASILLTRHLRFDQLLLSTRKQHFDHRGEPRELLRRGHDAVDRDVDSEVSLLERSTELLALEDDGVASVDLRDVEAVGVGVLLDVGQSDHIHVKF